MCVIDLGKGWNEGGMKVLPWDIFFGFSCFLLGKKRIWSVKTKKCPMGEPSSHLCFNLRPGPFKCLDMSIKRNKRDGGLNPYNCEFYEWPTQCLGAKLGPILLLLFLFKFVTEYLCFYRLYLAPSPYIWALNTLCTLFVLLEHAGGQWKITRSHFYM